MIWPGASLSQPAAVFVLNPVAEIRVGATVLVAIGALAALLEAASEGKDVPGETAVIEMGHPSESWVPTVPRQRDKITDL